MNIIMKEILLIACLLLVITNNNSPLISALDNGLAIRPPMGWLVWTRFMCQVDCDEHPNSCINQQLFSSMGEKLIEHKLADLGYQYVNIDDCWSQKERQNQKLVPDVTRFKNISGLAEELHDKKLKIGLYGDCGTSTCEGYPGQLELRSSDDKKTEYNDYFKLDSERLDEWQIDSFKLDGCNIYLREAEKICPKFATALKSIKRPILLTCEWPFYLMKDAKIPADKINWQLAIESCNVIRYAQDVEDSWASILWIVDFSINIQNIILKYHGPGHWFDPDMLVIGNFGLSKDQELAQMAIWSIWSAPLFMSNDLRSIGNSSLSILKNRNLIAVNQDPMGVFGQLVASGGRESLYGDYQVFAKPVLPIKKDCPSFVVVYFNRVALGNTKEMSFKLRDLIVNEKLINQAEQNSKSIDGKNSSFDTTKCLEYLRNDKKEIVYSTYDLTQQHAVPTKLHDIEIDSNLSFKVNPSGVRVIKLELKSV